MLLSDVMEHRVPDLVVAQHRTAAIEEAGKGKQHKDSAGSQTPAQLLLSHEPHERFDYEKTT